MMQEKFCASTQYDDMTGTAVADRHDIHTMEKYLKEKNLIHTDEVLIGVSMWSGEVHSRTQDDMVSISAIMSRARDVTDFQRDLNSPLSVRRVRFDMHLNEFFGLFKRFSICISNNGLIDQKEIIITD